MVKIAGIEFLIVEMMKSVNKNIEMQSGDGVMNAGSVNV